MKILLEITNVFEKKSEIMQVNYNPETTVGQLLDKNIIEMKGVLSQEVINPLEMVDFYYHDDVLYWDVNIYEMLVVDFIRKFPKFRHKIPVCVNFGGIGSTPHEIIEFSIELYNRVNLFVAENPLAVILMGYTIKTCKMKIKNWIESKNNCVKFSSFKNSLYAKPKWKLRDVEKALEIDAKSAKVVMRAMGYTYNNKNKIFTLTKRVDD